MKVYIESRKRKRQKQAIDSAIERFAQMGFERSRVVAALEGGGTIDRVMQTLIAQPEASSTTAPNDNSANSVANAPLPHNVSSDIQKDLVDDVEGPSNVSKRDDERDVDMEDELSADIAKSDALADYDIEVDIEGEAITEYLSLVESATPSSGKMLTSL
ncbi:NEDD8 ultimate buster 1 isoform X2 [Sesbania bispinosa]|nr:NEDD8 ultimate buster 1 isoform X2 [Sesbania bispinosa]